MRRAAFFALTSVSLAALMTVATLAHAVQPNVQMLGVLKSKQQWKVGTVESGDAPYCAMVGKFDQGSTLAFALSPEGFGSLGIEFQERLFKPGRKYEVELDIEKFGTRTFSGTASTARSLILQIGEDDALYDSLNRGNTLRVSTSAIEVRFEIKKFQGGYKKLVTCANVLAGPQEQQPGELPPAVMAQADPAVKAQTDMEQGEVSGAGKIFAPLRNVLQKFKGKPADAEVAQAASVMQYAEKDIVWNDEKPAAAKTAAVVKKKSAPAIEAVEPAVAEPAVVAAAITAAPAVPVAQPAAIQKTEPAAPQPQETAKPAALADVAEAPVRKERKLLASMAVTGHAMLAENVGMDAREMEKMQSSRLEREAERKQIELAAQAERAKTVAVEAKTAAQVDTQLAEGPAVLSAPVGGVATEAMTELSQARADERSLAKIEADRNVEEERLAALEIERAAKREADRIAAAERMAKIEEEARAEAVRLAKTEEETQAEIQRQMKAEQERTAQLKAEQEIAIQQKAEQERIARLEAEQKLAAAQVEEAARVEAARIAQREAERLALAKAEQERLAQLKAEQEKIAQLKAEQEKAAQVQAEQERLAKLEAERKSEEERAAQLAAKAEADAKAEAEHLALAHAEQERHAQLKAEQEKISQLKAEQEKISQLKAEQEKISQLKAEQEKIAQLKAEQEKIAQLKAEQELAAQQKAEQERIAKLDADRKSAEAARLAKQESDRQAERLRAEQEVARLRTERQALENRLAARVDAVTHGAGKAPAQVHTASLKTAKAQSMNGIEPAMGAALAAPAAAHNSAAAVPVSQRQVTAQAPSAKGNRAEAFLDSIMQHHRPAAPAARPAAPAVTAPAAPAAAARADKAQVQSSNQPSDLQAQPVLRSLPPSHTGAGAVTLETLLEQSGVRGAVFQPVQRDAGGDVFRQWSVGRLSGLYEQTSSRGKNFDALTKAYVSRYRDDCPGQLNVKLGNSEQTPAGIVAAGTLSCKMPNNSYETAFVFVQSGADFGALLHSGHPSDAAQVKSVGDNIYYTLSSSAGLSPLTPASAPLRAPAPARVPVTGNAASVYAAEPAARPAYAAPQTGGVMSPEPPVSSAPLFSTGSAAGSGEFETIVVE